MQSTTQQEEIVVGVILKPHGLQGMMKVLPTTDEPQRFERLEEVALVHHGTPVGIFHVESVHLSDKFVRLKLQELDSCEAVEALRGAEITIPRSACLPTDADQFYQFDLVGLEVFTQEGECLGKLAEVLPYSANDVWVVKNDAGQELLLPAIKSVIQKVDLEARRIIIVPIDGLLEYQ